MSFTSSVPDADKEASSNQRSNSGVPIVIWNSASSVRLLNMRVDASTIYWKKVRAAVDDEEVRYCSECRTPFMKDDHVTCL